MQENQLTINQFIDHKFESVRIAARELDRPLSTVRSWYFGRKAPRPLDAKKLIEQSGGLITWETVYLHYINKHEENKN